MKVALERRFPHRSNRLERLGGTGLEWEQAVVLQEHDRLLRRLQRDLREKCTNSVLF